ncbi:MAG TPA: hypothetical protein VIY86_12950, partial [Pirellulaceae bacterium]
TGSATTGTDYQVVSSTVTIPAGQASLNILVRPIDDNLIEAAETATVTLLGGPGYGVNGNQASATVRIVDNDVATSNNHFANRFTLVGATASAIGSNVGATRESGEPNIEGVSGGKSVWWTWTAPASGLVFVSTAGSSFDTTLGIYRGSTVTGLTRVATNDDEDYYGGIYTSEVAFYAIAGRAYQVMVDGYFGEAGNVRLSLESYNNRTAPTTGPRDNGQAALALSSEDRLRVERIERHTRQALISLAAGATEPVDREPQGECDEVGRRIEMSRNTIASSRWLSSPEGSRRNAIDRLFGDFQVNGNIL